MRRETEMTEITKKEWREREQVLLEQVEGFKRLESQSYRMLFAGAAFLAFGGMVAIGLGKVLGMSKAGQLYVEDLQTAFTNLGVAISEALVTSFGDALAAFADFIQELSKDTPFVTFIAVLGGVAVAVLGFGGGLLLTLGIIGRLATGFGNLLMTLGVSVSTAVTATGAFYALSVSLMAVAGGLLLGYMAGKWMVETFGAAPTMIAGLVIALGALAAVIMVIAMGISISTAGIAALAGLAAFGAAIAYVGATSGALSLPKGEVPPAEFVVPEPEWEYQLGTTMVKRGGKALLHGGEYVFNPQLPITPPPHMRGRGVSGPTMVNMTQNIDTVHTQADMEEMVDVTSKGIYDALSRSRLLGRTFVR